MVAANLSTVTKDILGSAAKYTTSYTIDTSTTAYANHFQMDLHFRIKERRTELVAGEQELEEPQIMVVCCIFRLGHREVSM